MRRLAQARNPYSRWWLWIPGLRGACHRAALCADPLVCPGMTKTGVASSLVLLATTVITSAILRRNIADMGRMFGEIVLAIFQMHALCRWRVLFDRHPGPPLGRRPDRPRDK